MVEIITVSHLEERDRLVDLFCLSFGKNMSVELWDWKYINNPLSSMNAEVIVAIDKGKLVGARPFLLTEMWVGNKKVVTAQHCDTMVHPEYRNKGIFNAMGQFAIQYLKEHNFTLSYGFSGITARPGFLSQGYRIVAPINVGFLPLNGRKLISYKLKNRVLGSSLGYLYDKLLITKRIPSCSNEFEVEVFDRFNEAIKEIEALRDEGRIDLVRDERNLRWRFDSHPHHDYRYIVVRNHQGLCGYAVITKQSLTNGILYGIITDYVVKERGIVFFRAIVETSLSQFTESGCDIVTLWAFSDPDFMNDLIKTFGFKSSDGFPYSQVFGTGYLEAILIDDRIADHIDIYNKSNWRITYAYQDIA